MLKTPKTEQHWTTCKL